MIIAVLAVQMASVIAAMIATGTARVFGRHWAADAFGTAAIYLAVMFIVTIAVVALRATSPLNGGFE